MNREPELEEKLHRTVREYDAKGYAHKARGQEIESVNSRRFWYLAVKSPKKYEYIRMVMDAATK